MRGLMRVGCSGQLKVAPDSGKVIVTAAAEVVQHRRRTGRGRDAARHLAVQCPQRVGGQSAPAVLAERIDTLFEKRYQGGAIGRTALGAAQGVDLQLRLVQPDLAEELHQHVQHLGIGQRVVHTGDLGADLVKLAVAPLLGALVAEHGAQVVHLCHRVLGIELVLDEGPHDPGRPFGPQGDGILALVDERVHLLLDDVGGIADGAAEQFGLLHDRHADLGKTVQFEDPPRGLLDVLPSAGFSRQDIIEAFDCCECHISLVELFRF